MNRKSKGLSVLFSLIFPGLGHFYIGTMQKGLLLMGLFILDIIGIVHFSLQMLHHPAEILLIIVCGLFVPVIYFYSLFDAIHTAVLHNRRSQAAESKSISSSPSQPSIGYARSEEDPAEDPQDFPESQSEDQSRKERWNGPILLIVGVATFFMIKSYRTLPLHKVYMDGADVVGIGFILAGAAMYFSENRRNRS